jgi:hypothetical protein
MEKELGNGKVKNNLLQFSYAHGEEVQHRGNKTTRKKIYLVYPVEKAERAIKAY